MFDSSLKKTVLSVDVSDSEGAFAICDAAPTTDLINWQTCREIFAKSFNSCSDAFYFSCSPKNQQSIISFIKLCENILDIKEKTKVYQTTNEYVILFYPDNFWKDCYVKRSLYTLLLRMGFYHQPSFSWEETMFGEYKGDFNTKISANKADVQKTKTAIERFFLGFTYFVGTIRRQPEYGPWKYGWVEEFQNRNKFEIKKLLIKNKIHLEELLFLSHDSLATI